MKLLLSSLFFFTVSAFANSKVFFVGLKDGDKVSSPVKIKMGLSGLKLRPAGEDVNDLKSGHHHLLVDVGPIPKGQMIPADDQHLHFGKAQTETTLALSPGDHTLTLQLADGAHRSYGPDLSASIKVHVEAKK